MSDCRISLVLYPDQVLLITMVSDANFLKAGRNGAI